MNLTNKSNTTPLTTLDDRLITLMKDELNTEEQQQFVNSFKLYLKHGYDDKAFVIDFDYVWKWIGFTRKDNAKTLLIKKFTENINYIYVNRFLHIQEPIELDNIHKKKINRDNEIILLNVSTFKKFCMKASTKRAEEICEYYIKMENIMFKYTNEKLIENQKRLNETQNTLTKTENKLKTFIEYDEELFWNENQVNDFNNKNVIYLAFIGIIDNERIYKFGKSEQIYTREFKQHQKFFDTFKMRYVIECDNMSFVEKEFKKFVKSLNLLRTKEIKNTNVTELFTITKKLNIDYIIENLVYLVQEHPLSNIKLKDDELKQKNDELRQKENEIKRMQIIHQSELLQLENQYLKLEDEKLRLENRYLKLEYEKINFELEKQKHEYEKLETKYNELIGKLPIIENKDNLTEINMNNAEETKEQFVETKEDIKEETKEITEESKSKEKKTRILEEITINKESITYNDFNIKDIVKEKLEEYKTELEAYQTYKPLIPEETLYKNTDIDKFFEKYVESGKDSRKNYYRLPVLRFYNFYSSLFENPVTRQALSKHIESNYNAINKKIHNNYTSKQMWVNVRIKNIQDDLDAIEILMKLFIDRYCNIDENLFMTSRIFNKFFKEFCIINEFETTKYNGWSEKKCIKAIENLGFKFDRDIYYQSTYRGLKLKSRYLTEGKYGSKIELP